VPITSTCHTT
jgi:hypothetical protein